MNSDIRLQVTFPSHPKIKKLKFRLGAEGVLSLVTLWIYAAQNKSKGNLAGLDFEDIAIAADWHGDPREFIEALVDLRLMDDVDGTLIIHDWRDHNPYAFHSEARSEKARNAALKRWEHKEALPDDANSNAASRGDDARSTENNAPSNAPSPSPPPSPDPPPSPKKEERESATHSVGQQPDDADTTKKKPTNDEAIQILEYLNKRAGTSYRPVESNLKLIRARLAEYSHADLENMVGNKCDTWREDDAMRQYLRPATLFNATKCAQYIGELPSRAQSGNDWRDDPIFDGAI